ncbi:hypothetical protein PCE1_001492 [Barthelona sp. PCE]
MLFNSDYVEPLDSTRHLFNMFDIDGDGQISHTDLRTIMRSLGLYPDITELKGIIREVSQTNTKVNFETFLEMRHNKSPVELNVLAEFKKFDVSDLYRGFVTPDGIRRVLAQEGWEEDAIRMAIREILELDSNSDGKVSYLDFYDFMLNRVPDEWLDWIYENICRGVADHKLVSILLDNGFPEELAQELITITKENGRQMLKRSYADNAKSYVYTVRS